MNKQRFEFLWNSKISLKCSPKSRRWRKVRVGVGVWGERGNREGKTLFDNTLKGVAPKNGRGLYTHTLRTVVVIYIIIFFLLFCNLFTWYSVEYSVLFLGGKWKMKLKNSLVQWGVCGIFWCVTFFIFSYRSETVILISASAVCIYLKFFVYVCGFSLRVSFIYFSVLCQIFSIICIMTCRLSWRKNKIQNESSV